MPSSDVRALGRKEGKRRREGGGKREERKKERERRIAERRQEGGEGRGRVSCGPFQGEQCISQHSSHDNVLECRHYVITFNIYIQINCLHINKMLFKCKQTTCTNILHGSIGLSVAIETVNVIVN